MPRISVIVIIYRMQRQAANTLRSLSLLQQKNVNADDYEVIAVENNSDSMLDESILSELGPNIHYYRRTENGVSPAPAINFALSKARGEIIGLIIDGARMVTPRVLEYALKAHAISRNGLTCIPSYYLGPCEHHLASAAGYTESTEAHTLTAMRWEENPYRLFDFSILSAANPQGFFQPFMECNCFFTSRRNFTAIGDADERFDQPGGGAINMYLLRKIGMLPECTHYFVMPGEGSFHQLHGGITTSDQRYRQALLASFSERLNALWTETPFRSFNREPILIGPVSSHAQKYLLHSSQRAMVRFRRLTEKGKAFWHDDIEFFRWTERQQRPA